MTQRRDVLERIAAALERLSPTIEPPVDWMSDPAYLWDAQDTRTLRSLDAVPLATLRGIESQKAAVLENLLRLSRGSAAHDMLLWGARGMGKSALIRAAAASVQSENSGAMAVVQTTGAGLQSVSQLLPELQKQSRAFLLFIDDLGFSADQKQDMLALRSLLDGGLMGRPANVKVAVTSNHRAIVSRMAIESDTLHERDERDDTFALADRFGLALGFHPCDRATYLEIVGAYVAPLGLGFDEEEALAWAIGRGNRSGRTALQFATELAGRAGLALHPTTR